MCGVAVALCVFRPIHTGPLTRIVALVAAAVPLTWSAERQVQFRLWTDALPLMLGMTVWRHLDPLPSAVKWLLELLLLVVTLIILAVVVTLLYELVLRPIFALFEAENRLRQRVRDHRAERIMERVLAARRAHEPLPCYSLYLRPFRTSGQLDQYSVAPDVAMANQHQGTSIQIDLEATLAAAFPAHRPLIAAGRHGVLLSTMPKAYWAWPIRRTWDVPGTGKFRCRESNWRMTVTQLARNAESVIIVPLNYKGTKWEITWMVRQGLLHKCIFIMPTSPYGGVNHRNRWNEARRFLRSLGLVAPEYDDRGAILTVGPDGVTMVSCSSPLTLLLPRSLSFLIDFTLLRRQEREPLPRVGGGTGPRPEPTRTRKASLERKRARKKRKARATHGRGRSRRKPRGR
ncbi:hypothetical protein ADL04_01505 [Streptomyces sp. NRRL B-3648]|nr:hypothetical protein ADL04_01505 [Streptomyces sp. NRRL B-3648]